MTTFQIISLLVLLGVAAWTYMPKITLPDVRRKPATLKQIAQVMAIRDSSTNKSVIEDCNKLLQSLLQ